MGWGVWPEKKADWPVPSNAWCWDHRHLYPGAPYPRVYYEPESQAQGGEA